MNIQQGSSLSLLDLKRQQFRQQQRQRILDKIFNERRKSIKSLDQLKIIIQKQDFDSYEYQNAIDYLTLQSQSVNLQEITSSLLQNICNLLDVQIDNGFYLNVIKILIIFQNQIEHFQQMEIINELKQIGISKLAEFYDQQILQIFELLLIHSPLLIYQELQILFQYCTQWLQDWNMDCVIISVNCLYLIFKKDNSFLNQEIVYNTLQLLDTDYKQLGLQILSLVEWEIFQESDLYQIWNKIAIELFNTYYDQQCAQILWNMSQVFKPIQLMSLCEYLNSNLNNSRSTNLIIDILCNIHFDSYCPLLQMITNQLSNRLLNNTQSNNEDKIYLFFENNRHLIDKDSIPEQILDKFQYLHIDSENENNL